MARPYAGTLRILLRFGCRLIAHCELCRRFISLALDSLAKRLGVELKVPEVRRRLRCMKCGLKRASVQEAVPW
jgi:hypothetical protein